ncbi:MAG: hypothetical protein JWO73_44 [Candidatus Taylorbacteria bacterium]|nr:hypothetical protein [Candidatus Taylorbacteria bacterium]
MNFASIVSLILMPEIAHADTAQATAVTKTILGPIMTYILQPAYMLLVALAVVVFIWGTAQFILSGEDSEKRSEAQQHILWGVIGLFIMFAVFGIVRFVGSTLGVDVPLF